MVNVGKTVSRPTLYISTVKRQKKTKQNARQLIQDNQFVIQVFLGSTTQVCYTSHKTHLE